MKKLGFSAAVVLAGALWSGQALAADLADVSKAMGEPGSVQFSGNGQFFSVGQAFRPGLPWPKMNLMRYTRLDDYEKAGQTVDYVLTRGDMLGGGGIPLIGELRVTGGISGDQGWAVLYPMGTATAAPATPRQHDLWTSPHGIVKAALADKVSMQGNSFEVSRAGKFKAKATVNAQNMIERVESWVDNPVLGDMHVVTTYWDYKDHNGVKFPSRIIQTAGGFPAFDLVVSEVRPNAGSVQAPASIAPTVSEVKVDKAADGVWFIHGGSHHSIAIEMRDHVIMFESPLGDGRANAAIQAIKDTIPNKPIRYVVVTHHHFDHSGGLRAAAAEDATIVLHETAKSFFEQAYAAPRTLNPDKLARAGKTAKFEAVGDKHVLTDGSRTLELYVLRNNQHADGFIIGYLPKEKIMMVADAFSPRAPVTAVPAFLSPVTGNLWQNLQRLNLDIDTVLPIHGRMVKVQELRLEAGVR